MTIMRLPDPQGQIHAQPIYIEVGSELTGTADSSTIYGEEEVRGRPAERVMELARDVLEDGVELARQCASRIGSSLTAMPANVRAPDEFEVQFAIKLDAQVGAILAKASTGAHIQVKMRWARIDPVSDSDD